MDQQKLELQKTHSTEMEHVLGKVGQKTMSHWLYMSRVAGNPVLGGGGVPTRSDTNRVVQPLKIARGWKF